MHVPVEVCISMCACDDLLIDVLDSRFSFSVFLHSDVNISDELVEVLLVFICYKIVLGMHVLEPLHDLSFVEIESEGMVLHICPFGSVSYIRHLM